MKNFCLFLAVAAAVVVSVVVVVFVVVVVVVVVRFNQELRINIVRIKTYNFPV